MRAPERLDVATNDYDEAIAAMRSAFGNVRFRRDEDCDPALSMRAARIPELAATRWSLDGVVGSAFDRHNAAAPTFLTGIRLGGEGAMWSGHESVDITRPFLYPDVINSWMRAPAVANLAIAEDVVIDHASAMTGGVSPHFRFTGTAPLNPALEVLWHETILHAARSLQALSAQTEITLASTGLLDHVVLTLLHTFPNTALEVEQRQRIGRAQQPSLRRALQYIDDQLDAPFTVPELAAAARLSIRGLHAMFRRELDTTPMAYVRQARLTAARAELERENPASTEVAVIAVRWGFPRVRQFQQQYLAAFAEAPEDTLRR